MMTRRHIRFRPAICVGALASGTGPAAVVYGVRASSAIAAALLVAGILLSRLIHPDSHARQSVPRTPAHERS